MYITRKLVRDLVLQINPEEYYPVSYTVLQNRERVYIPTYLKGEDLTEKQIIELYKNGDL